MNRKLAFAKEHEAELTLAVARVLQIRHVEAWAIDPVMVGYLKRNLASLGVPHTLREKGFILDSIGGGE